MRVSGVIDGVVRYSASVTAPCEALLTLRAYLGARRDACKARGPSMTCDAGERGVGDGTGFPALASMVI